MKKQKKNSIPLAIAGVMSLLVITGCGGGKDEGMVDTKVEKYSVGELDFGKSDKVFVNAIKSSVVVSGEYTYVGTDYAGIWARKNGDAIFTRIAGINEATKPQNAQLKSEIAENEDFSVIKMKPFTGGVVAMVKHNQGLVVIMDGEVFATFVPNKHGVPDAVFRDFLVFENGKDKYLIVSTNLETAGCAIILLKDTAEAVGNGMSKSIWVDGGTASGTNDKLGIVTQMARVGDNLIFFVLSEQKYFEFPKEIVKPHATEFMAPAPLKKFDAKRLHVKDGQTPNKAIETLYGNGDVAFLGMDDGSASTGRSPDLGGVATKKGDAYIAPQVGGLSAFDYAASGAKTLILTDKGYMIADGAVIGPLVNKASSATKFAVVPRGTKAQQVSGWTSELPIDDFRSGAIAADGTIYLISWLDEYKYKIYTVSTTVETVKTKG